MQIHKLRNMDAAGLVPAGQYFKRLTDALRETSETPARAVPRHERSAKAGPGLELVQ
jgi:hypothetical protein